MHHDPPCSTAIASYVHCSSYTNTQHGIYIILTSIASTFVKTLHIFSYKEFAIGMTSYLPVHNGSAACTRVSKDKKTLAYLPAGACKMHLCA